MTNYEKLFKEQMQDSQFAKVYYESRIDRMINDLLESLQEKISNNESKEELLKTIDDMRKQLA
jgi:aspartate/glutamate racemase